MNKFQRRAFVVLQISLTILLFFNMFFINDLKTVSSLICAVAAVLAVITLLPFQKGDFTFVSFITEAFCATAMIFGITWLATGKYWAYLVMDFAVLGELIWAYILLLKSETRKAVKIPSAIVGALCGIVLVALTAVAVNSDVVVKLGQMSFNAYNSYEPHAATEMVTQENGVTYINDIAYGAELPNSYFDIYLSPYGNENSPTLVWCHGGGYVWGDKVGGDPNAKDSGQEWYLNAYLDAGCNVVCPNYAFASEYPYPTSLLQLNDFLAFLVEHGGEYGLNMDQVILAGGSAGGNLAGMLALINTNSQIANMLGVDQVIDAGAIKCVVFCSALINNEEFSVTNDATMDYLFLQCGRSAMSSGLLKGNEIAHKTNITAWVDENYPPCYISDGNNATFNLQAEALHKKLDELGVPNQLNLYTEEEETLFHGFETSSTSPSAQDNLKKTIAFVKQFVVMS
ncbi:MAG: alpha/beta hydrolase [Acetatifactor sp.]